MTNMCKEMCGLTHDCNIDDCKIVQEHIHKLRQNLRQDLLKIELLLSKAQKELKKLRKTPTFANVVRSCDTCKSLEFCKIWINQSDNGKNCKCWEHV